MVLVETPSQRKNGSEGAMRDPGASLSLCKGKSLANVFSRVSWLEKSTRFGFRLSVGPLRLPPAPVIREAPSEASDTPACGSTLDLLCWKAMAALARFYHEGVVYSRNRLLWRVDLDGSSNRPLFTTNAPPK
jgi:hypothetical protein